MSRGDTLDVVLRRINNIEDWKTLVDICECDWKIKPVELSHTGLVKAFNQEIRSNYGHTLFNMFRDEYEPDYEEIVREVANKLDVKNVPYRLHDVTDVEYAERLIVGNILEKMKENIIKKEGWSAWLKIEEDANRNMERLYQAGKISGADYSKMSGSGGIIALIVAGKLSGFGVYILANQLFFAVARSLGISVGVAVAGPIIGRTISMFLGPVGWILSGLWLVADLGSTNWKRTIGTVFFIAVLRQQQKYTEAGLISAGE